MKMTFRTTIAALTLVAAAGLGACASDGNNSTATEATPVAEAKATNKTCPFSGGKANPNITSTHDGKAVAFCCPGCKGKFDKMDDAHQHEILAKAK